LSLKGLGQIRPKSPALNLSCSLEELIEENDSFYLVCWDGDFLGACFVLKPVSTQIIRMRQLVVVEKLQGRGFKKRLVSFAKYHGYLEIIIHIRETAVGFYEKLGYIKEGDSFIGVTIPHFLLRRILEYI